MYNSQTQSSPFASLKRPRDEKQLPPLPKLTSELILQVYTHISLRRRSDDGPEEYGDNERLVELGKAVLDALITYVLFNKRPMLTVAELRVGLFISHDYVLQVDKISINEIECSRMKM
jgi:dsRNA-specific ribonuclease